MLKRCFVNCCSSLQPKSGLFNFSRQISTTFPLMADGEQQDDGRNFKEKCINQVLLLGRCGADPQRRGTEERPVILFPLATSSPYETGDGKKGVRTEWHRIAIFRSNLGDSVTKYLKKGRRVLVQGRILYGEVTDTEGNSRKTTTIAADDVTFVDSQRKIDTDE